MKLKAILNYKIPDNLVLPIKIFLALLLSETQKMLGLLPITWPLITNG